MYIFLFYLINHHHHQLYYFSFAKATKKVEARKDQEIIVDIKSKISSDINDRSYLSLYCGNAFNK
jgi:hypothetical protein